MTLFSLPALLLLIHCPIIDWNAVQPTVGENRLFAAVFMVRGSVAGANVGSYGAFVQTGGDTSWRKLNRSNAICFGITHSTAGWGKRVYLACGNGVHRSTDDGATWKILTSWQTEEIRVVLPDPDDSTLIYAGTPFGVFKSTDDGATWVAKRKGFKKFYIQQLIMDCENRKVLYAASEDDLYRSSDQGEHWQPLKTGLTQFTGLAQHPRDPETLIVGCEDKGVFVSHDTGRTWTSVIPTMSWYAFTFTTDGEVLYAGGFGTGLWQSTDGGNHWLRLDFTIDCEAISAIGVDPRNGNTIVVGTHGQGVYVSSDRGGTWRFDGLRGAIVQQLEFLP
jgi:photosystem II stability/assembly factor-like uncharacterized protein